MRLLTSVLQAALRNIRPRKQNADKVFQKVKFTDSEITEMGQYNRNPKARNFKDLFTEKYEDKIMQDYLKSQKQQSETQTEEQIKQSQKPAMKMQKKSKQQKQQSFKTFKIYKHLDRLESIRRENAEGAAKGDVITNQSRLQALSRVRLIQQFLPYQYMKRVQKVMHKYDQATLRNVAFHFTNLMRLRYNQEKIDYEQYADLQFQRLQDKLPSHRKVQQIYLTSKEKALEERAQSKRKEDQNPIQPQIKYTQNMIVSYLLNRVPRTYAVAYRVLHEIKQMYEQFKPTSFIDFGSGLSSGSAAFVELFGDTGSVFSVQPASKMRKMGKYLTDYSKIQHFQSLAELSSQVKQVDVVYCGYVLNQLRPELIPVYLESLYAKVKPQGFLILTQYGNPFGARLIHESRKWALTKKIRIAAPCPHHMKCPMTNSKHWCHFDQPSGMLPRQVFGKLPSDNSIKLEKYSYIVIQKLDENDSDSSPPIPSYIQPNESHGWDRVLFPLMKKGKHFIYNLCTKSGRFTKKITAKSHGGQYKLGRRLKWGDLWRFGARIPNRYRKQRRTGKRLW